MENIEIIEGRNVLEISLVSTNNPYKGKKTGKFFNNYKFNGIVFPVDTDMPFCKDFAEGKVTKVKLIKGERTVSVTDSEGVETQVQKPTYSFDTAISSTQLIGVIRAQAAIAQLERKLQQVDLSEAEFEDMLASA